MMSDIFRIHLELANLVYDGNMYNDLQQPVFQLVTGGRNRFEDDPFTRNGG